MSRIVMLLGRSTGGIGTHVSQLVADLRAQGEDVEIVTDPLTRDRFGLVDAHPWWPDPRDPKAAVRGLRRLRALAAQADVVHAHGHQAGLVGFAAVAGRRRPRLIVSLHNAVLERGGAWRAANAAQRLVASRAALVTGASTDLVREATAHGARWAELAPVPSPRVPDLLADPVLSGRERDEARAGLLADLGEQPGPDVAPGARLVVTISRIAPQKRLGDLLDAAAELTGPAAPFVWVVIGDGVPELAATYRERIAAEGLPVRLIGAVPDPSRWLRAADVFALTSTWEARALVVQEAMAAGVPVVSTDAGGLHDLVDGVGELVRVGDPAGLAARVGALLADPERRAALREAGRARAATWPDGNDTARQWRRWYEQARG
ncbi:glycosyltransferase family 4 protein [Janibacter sp. G56]|uniref:glycosyltransferase family 4 protein n=1 Tax=Janibacter sp. G56 TaxID=3418717 RepID=UPI003D036CB9